MQYTFGVFGSDSINRAGSRIPCEVFAAGLESHAINSIREGFPLGAPMHLAHDLHRLIAWSETTGLLLMTDVAAFVGFICTPETDAESARLAELQRNYLRRHTEVGSAASVDFMTKALVPKYIEAKDITFCDAAVLYRKGIAATLYPELFDEKSNLVDKDGLTDYRGLLRCLECVHPGVFLDRRRGLLIFAHQFFRRSLSRINNLNEYFLDRFARVANENPELDCRLRLDRDAIGHADAYKGRIELEYWHGPKFNSDLSAIKSGVAVHKASERERLLEGIDETHFWWKSAETRTDAEGERFSLRTLEIEEITDVPSYGLGDDEFGCRYIHSECDLDAGTVTHFDGAIRAYCADAYAARRATEFNRAGKHADYTKLFRIDRSLAVENWKDLLGAFFRGNTLIGEYFGVDRAPSFDTAPPTQATAETSARPPMLLVSYRASPSTGERSKPSLVLDRITTQNGLNAEFTEFAEGSALVAYYTSRFDVRQVLFLAVADGVLNLPRFILPSGVDRQGLHEHIKGLQEAMDVDSTKGLVTKLAASIAWTWHDLLITVSAAGTCEQVSLLLHYIDQVVDPTQPPSAWIATLKSRMSELDCVGAWDSDLLAGIIHPRGILVLPHPVDPNTKGFHASWMIPKSRVSSLKPLFDSDGSGDGL